MSKSSTTPAQGRSPRTVRRRRWSARRIFLAILAALAAATTIAALVPTTRWVHATGIVMTGQEADIRPHIEGVIEQCLVRDGELVEKDQLLIQLKDSVQKAAHGQAVSDLKVAEARLAHLLAVQELDESRRSKQVFQAERRLQLARDRLKGMQDVSGTGGGASPQDIRRAGIEVELAASRLEELKLSCGQVAEKQVAVFRQEIAAAGKKVALHLAEVNSMRIRSALGGTVYLNRFQPGEVVKPTEVLGQVFDRRSWIVRLKLPECCIGHVREGQPVDVELAARASLKCGRVKATIVRVLPVITPQATGDGVFYVEAKIDGPADLTLSPGMKATAGIDTGKTTWLGRVLDW